VVASAEIVRPSLAPASTPPLRVTFAWALAGNVIYAGCQWGMISVLAKLGSTTAVGQFALALAITAPIFMLTNLALRSVEATDARSEFGFGQYFTLRITSTSLAFVTILAIVTLLRYDRKVSAVIVLIGLAKAVESFSDVIAGLLQKRERLDQVAISMMLKGGFSIVAFGATFYYLRSVEAACVALIVAWLSVFLAYDLRLARNLVRPNSRFIELSIKRLSQLAKLSLPLGIVAALSSFNFNIPRYVLQHYRGASELGIFSALGYVTVAMTLLVNALAQSAIVRLSRNFATGHLADYSRLLLRMAALCIVATVVAVMACRLFGSMALRILYGREYAAHVGLLQLFVAIAGVTAVAAVLGCGMTAARRFRAQLPVLTATVLVCAIGAIRLTPKLGAVGAALAMLISATVQVAGSYWVVRKAISQPISTLPPTESSMLQTQELVFLEEMATE
jgi:O-antigen/teichoic acid export membrane protein